MRVDDVASKRVSMTWHDVAGPASSSNPSTPSPPPPAPLCWSDFMAAAAINLRRLESRSITDAGAAPTMKQGLTLVHVQFSAQRKRFLLDRGCS